MRNGFQTDIGKSAAISTTFGCPTCLSSRSRQRSDTSESVALLYFQRVIVPIWPDLWCQSEPDRGLRTAQRASVRRTVLQRVSSNFTSRSIAFRLTINFRIFVSRLFATRVASGLRFVSRSIFALFDIQWTTLSDRESGNRQNDLRASLTGYPHGLLQCGFRIW